MKDGMPDAGDEDYEGFCKTIKNSAIEIVEAVKLKSSESASKPAGQYQQGLRRLPRNLSRLMLQ